MLEARSIFLDCAVYLLRPMVRFCLQKSLTYKDILPLLKRLFVEEAQSELMRHGAEASASKLSIMTGLQRPDVALYLNSKSTSIDASPIARVVSQWSTDKRYANSQGKPKALELTGRNSEFAQLVASVSKELNSYAVLFDLERLKLAERDEEKLILKSTAFVANRDVETAFRFLGNDVSDIVTAVQQNVFETSESPNLHVKAHFDNIVKEAVPHIRKDLLKMGSEFIRTVQLYVSHYDKDVNPDLARQEGGARVALGLYSVTADTGGQSGVTRLTSN